LFVLLSYYFYLIVEKHYNITATMDAPQGQHDCEMAQLVRQIVDFPEGSPCFLCLTTEGRECVWDDIGDEITMEGRNTIIWHEASKGHFMCHPPLPKVIVPHAMLATAITFTLPAIGPKVLVMSES